MKSYAHSLSTWKNVALIGIFTFLLAACGDDSKAAGGTEEDSAITAIKDKTVSGVSQKGPFVKGASVTVYELDGKSLSQTGRSYEGKIKNERGEFSVDVVKLESQYALLKADGYYRNEITGEKSNSTVTLYAMTNLSDRNEVNVNLLTHLEYERSRYLVKYEKMGVGKAKLQAESEVLKSFGIEDEFENSENLNIFGEDDGSAALLAVSVLMQGDLKEADFTERLTEYADDIEEDGVWDDKKTATKIADWAAEKSLNGGLTTIRDNIAGWELSADVPAFEKYVNNYWWQNYGLGSCTEKREGEVLQNTNALSEKRETYFICKKGAWRVAVGAETIEADSACTSNNLNVYYIPPKVDGDNNYSYYKCTEDGWVFTTEKLNQGTVIDERDGREYKTIGIKSQMWMGENLNYELENSTCYDNDGNKCNIYGRLYTWAAAVGMPENECGSYKKCTLPSGNIQGICPSGWHLPSLAEWEKLIDVVGDTSTAGKELKSSSGWNEYLGKNGNGTDTFGFSALPAGSNHPEEGDDYREGLVAYFWSSTQCDESGSAWYLNLYFRDGVYLWRDMKNYGKDNGFSVRCLKD